MRTIWFLLLVLTISIPSALAGVDSSVKKDAVQSDNVPGLQDYLRYAAENNAGLKAAFSIWREAVTRIAQVTSLDDPMFSFGYYLQKVETRVGPQEYSFGLSQKFPWFGKLKLKGEIAREEAQTAWEELEVERLELFYRVKRAYYEYYYLHQMIKITEENQKLLTYFEEIARTKFMVGQVPQQHVLKAQVELGKLSNDILTLRDQRPAMMAELNAALNRPLEESLPWPEAFEKTPLILDEARIMALASEHNPQLKAFGHRITRDQRRFELAKKEYYPDFSAGINYIVTGPASGDMQVDGSGKDPIILGFSINIPFQLERRQAAVEESLQSRAKNTELRQEQENEILSRLQMVLYQLRDAERRMNLYKESLIPKAEHSMLVTQSAYISNNKADFLDLLDDQRVLLNFSLAYQRAVADYEERLAETEMLTGQHLSEREKTNEAPEK